MGLYKILEEYQAFRTLVDNLDRAYEAVHYGGQPYPRVYLPSKCDVILLRRSP
jgi:hypothetical protein